MDIKERIKQFIKYLQIGQNAFERECRLSVGYINNVGSSIGSNVLLKILNRYPQINPEWLLLGTGDMIRTQGDTSERENVETYKTKIKELNLKYIEVCEEMVAITKENRRLYNENRELLNENRQLYKILAEEQACKTHH